jgi:hypothetical protein
MVGGVSSKQLQGLIHTALQRNYDVRIAATRILQAQAQVGIDLTQLEHPELFAGGGTQPARHCHHQRRGKQHTRLEHS